MWNILLEWNISEFILNYLLSPLQGILVFYYCITDYKVSLQIAWSSTHLLSYSSCRLYVEAPYSLIITQGLTRSTSKSFSLHSHLELRVLFCSYSLCWRVQFLVVVGLGLSALSGACSSLSHGPLFNIFFCFFKAKRGGECLLLFWVADFF